jgi:hypothetical protein
VKFSVTAHYSEFLPVGDATVDIIATVRAEPAGPGEQTRQDDLAEVILLDCSGSMGAPQAKMRAAQAATVAAIDVLPDGVSFAVVGGNHLAEMVYPESPRLAIADENTRAAARKAVRRVSPHGGTAIGEWLRLAHALISSRPDAVGHAILLTDGRNESQTAEELRAAIDACAGTFTVDCRAIGSTEGVHDWDGRELLGIADALGAKPVVPVEDIGILPDEFTAVLRQALASRAAEVQLRVRHTGIAQIRFVKQVYPVIADRTRRGHPAGTQAVDHPTDAWSPGDRNDFHVVLTTETMAPETRRRIASLTVRDAAAADQEPDEVGITVEWTDEVQLFTAVDPTVAHYTSQQDLAEAIRHGSAALLAGERDQAVRQFGLAVALCNASGNQDKLALLARVVDIDDAAAGRVRVRDDIDLLRLPPLTASGPQTSSWQGDRSPAAPAPRRPVTVEQWEHCGQTRVTRFCGACGTRHDAAGS